MIYQVLAQKYRPQTFDDVVGQEAVTRTLKNSIVRKRIANAYVFCGPRGVGKTSVARLLSKTLNCEEPPEKSPCNNCISCEQIARGNNIDVLEIDGASNRGIDEIRALRENVKFSPSRGQFKVYIIDEVHMLTQEAFNALLKTLEEPPAHVKFIFATTEPHKVLPTIMSRCQRFDFKKIPPKIIFDRIMDIAKREKIDIDEKAALLIARSADGSLRDSLVILDQMVSFSGKKILSDDVVELLGMIHKDRIFELSEAVVNGASKDVAGIVDDLINNGKDPVFITNSLIGHYRDMMILKTTNVPTTDMAFASDELKLLQAQLEKLSLDEILYILQNLSHCLTLMKGAIFARAFLEITLIRLSKRHNALSLPDILSRLENIERAGGSGIDLSMGEKANTSMSVENPAHTGIPHRGYPREVPDAPEIVSKNGNNDLPPANFDTSRFSWKSVLNYVKNKKMSVFTFLDAGKPVEFSGDKIVIGFAKDHAFNKEALETNGNKSIVEEAVNKVTGCSPKIQFTLLDFLGKAGEERTDTAEKKAKARETMKPVIEKAIDVFGGQVIGDYTEGR